MEGELLSALEKKVEFLMAAYSALKHENALLVEENRKLVEERNGIKCRIDAILAKLEGI